MAERKDGQEIGDSGKTEDSVRSTSGEHDETSGGSTENPDHKSPDVKSWVHNQDLNFDRAVFGLEQIRGALLKNLNAEKETLKKMTGLRDSYKK